MAEAADAVLGPAVWIDTDVEIVRYPALLRPARSSHVGSGDVPAQPGYFEYFEYFQHVEYFECITHLTSVHSHPAAH